jgi:hypothetical protein
VAAKLGRGSVVHSGSSPHHSHHHEPSQLHTDTGGRGGQQQYFDPLAMPRPQAEMSRTTSLSQQSGTGSGGTPTHSSADAAQFIARVKQVLVAQSQQFATAHERMLQRQAAMEARQRQLEDTLRTVLEVLREVQGLPPLPPSMARNQQSQSLPLPAAAAPSSASSLDGPQTPARSTPRGSAVGAASGSPLPAGAGSSAVPPLLPLPAAGAPAHARSASSGAGGTGRSPRPQGQNASPRPQAHVQQSSPRPAAAVAAAGKS